VAGGSALVFALVLRWALGVFTRRLFGVDVGVFGKARDAAVAAAVAAPSLLVVLLPGLIWTSVSSL
jgi:hypothetical protein